MIKSQWKKILAVMASLCMLLTIIVLPASVNAAEEEEKGSIEVVAKPHYAGLPLYLVTIGEFKNGDISLYDDFKQFDIQLSDFSSSSVLAEKLYRVKDYVVENDVDGIVRYIGVDGNTTFSDLDTGKLYVVMQPVVSRVVDIAPALAFIPARDESGELSYHLRIQVKPSEPAEHENLGGMILHKKDDKNRPLEGAEFSVWRKNFYTDESDLPEQLTEDYELGEDAAGKYYWYRLPEYTLITDVNGQAFADELFVDYQYRLIEEKAPEGYILDKTPHEFYIDDHCRIELENGIAVVKDGTAQPVEVTNMPYVEESDASIIDESSKPGQQSQSSKASSPTPSYPTPSRSTTVTAAVPTTPDIGKVIVEITGDDLVKYIVIPVVVGVSLLLVILLFVLGGKKKNKDEEE